MQRSSLIDLRRILSVFVLLFSLSAACQTQPAPDARATNEIAVRNLDIEWSKAAGTKDVNKTVSYYSDDANVMPPNNPLVTGRASIHALWKGMLETPGFSGGWNPAKVEVARSGDLAYVSGTYEFKETDAKGKPMIDRGKYLEVWKKQPDGTWKCTVDIFNSDLPVVAPTTESKTAAAEKK